MFAVLALVAIFDRKFRRYHIFGRFWRADWRRFRQLWALGLPIAAALVFEVSIFNGAVVLMGLIGKTSLAAHSIAIQIASVAFMVPLGFGQAASVRVGRAFGANDREAISRAGWTAYAMGVGFMGITASMMLFAPHVLIGAFLDAGNPENWPVVELATVFLALAALFQLVDGAQVVGSGMLRGLHDTRIPMIFAALGYWGIGFPLGVILGFPLGLEGAGIWIGLADRPCGRCRPDDGPLDHARAARARQRRSLGARVKKDGPAKQKACPKAGFCNSVPRRFTGRGRRTDRKPARESHGKTGRT